MEQREAASLAAEHLKTIYAYALSRTANTADAEDLAGDIVLAILAGAQNIRNDHAFYGYLWAVARNTCNKFLQKKQTHRTTALDETIPSEEPDMAETLYQKEERAALRRELAILSREYRECTVAYYMNDLSCSEISARRGISIEMVKYYLFKTRKLLKEGIGMERAFGEKSYHPSPFTFITIFSGQFNREYRNLFNRKLPGNILVSAYYTPMTVRALAMELGVAAVYLEDEIAMLEKYNLLTALPGEKYQTNLVIFTESYQKEFIRTAEESFRDTVGDILKQVKAKLPAVREIGFVGAGYDDNRLCWSLLFYLMWKGNALFEDTHPKSARSTELYDGATGTNYGIDHIEAYGEYGCDAFAGYAGLSDTRYAVFANFSILPDVHHVQLNEMYETAPHFTKEQLARVETILSAEIDAFAFLYNALSVCAVRIMREHAPRSVHSMVEAVIEQTLFFRTVGILGALAVHSGEMTVPDDPDVRPMLVCETAEAGCAPSDEMI